MVTEEFDNLMREFTKEMVTCTITRTHHRTSNEECVKKALSTIGRCDLIDSVPVYDVKSNVSIVEQLILPLREL